MGPPPPHRSDPSLLTTTILRPQDALDLHSSGWQFLAEVAANGDCFATPAMFRAWLATLAIDVDVDVITVTSHDRLVGLLPVMRARVWRGPRGVTRHDFAPTDARYLGTKPTRPFRLRQLSPVVSMPSAWVARGPLVAPEHDGAVHAALARALRSMPEWDVLALPTDEGAEQTCWTIALRDAGLRPWVLPLGREIAGISNLCPFDQMIATRSRNYRKNVRRARKAAAQHGLTIVRHHGQVAVAKHLDQMAQVASDSWKARPTGGLSIPFAGAQEAYFRRLMADPDPWLTPILAVASVDGTPVAVLLSLLTGDRLTAVLTFHSGAVPKASPGLLLLAHMIDWAADQGLSEYDLNATHPWLRHLVDTSRHQNLVVAFARHPKGRFHAMVSAATRALR